MCIITSQWVTFCHGPKSLIFFLVLSMNCGGKGINRWVIRVFYAITSLRKRERVFSNCKKRLEYFLIYCLLIAFFPQIKWNSVLMLIWSKESDDRQIAKREKWRSLYFHEICVSLRGKIWWCDEWDFTRKFCWRKIAIFWSGLRFANVCCWTQRMN